MLAGRRAEATAAEAAVAAERFIVIVAEEVNYVFASFYIYVFAKCFLN